MDLLHVHDTILSVETNKKRRHRNFDYILTWMKISQLSYYIFIDMIIQSCLNYNSRIHICITVLWSSSNLGSFQVIDWGKIRYSIVRKKRRMKQERPNVQGIQVSTNLVWQFSITFPAKQKPKLGFQQLKVEKSPENNAANRKQTPSHPIHLCFLLLIITLFGYLFCVYLLKIRTLIIHHGFSSYSPKLAQITNSTDSSGFHVVYRRKTILKYTFWRTVEEKPVRTFFITHCMNIISKSWSIAFPELMLVSSSLDLLRFYNCPQIICCNFWSVLPFSPHNGWLKATELSPNILYVLS